MNEAAGRKYIDKTLQQLKQLLRERNLKVSGKKKDLVERLMFHDANSDLHRTQLAPEYIMSLPDLKAYLDLHLGHRPRLPKFTSQRLLDFLASCQKKLDPKVEDLYFQRYIRYIKWTILDTSVYFNAAVWAEMKKSTSYTVDIKLNGDHRAVEETQCECAVGQGPSAHCKHVACVLFALTAYHDTGESLTAVTCTEVLQNFHRAKPNKGSPLKASNLAEIRKKQPILFDPRPMKRRNPEKIEEVLRNVVMNWQDKPRLPLLQKYYPANIPALYADHDYMKLTAEDHFLEQHRVSHITHKEAETMEVSTRGQSKNSRWAEERKLRLTSSNFGTLCKITGNRNIKALLNDLVTGRDISSKYLAHGIKYENIAVERFGSQSGLKTTECGLFVSTTRPWLAASPDRVIDDDTILEVKCPYTARDQVVSERSVPYLSNLDGNLLLKHNHCYYYQIQGQLFCSCRKSCKLLIFTFKGIKVIDVKYNEAFVASMLSKLDAFYNDHYKQAVLSKHLYKNVQKYGLW